MVKPRLKAAMNRDAGSTAPDGWRRDPVRVNAAPENGEVAKGIDSLQASVLIKIADDSWAVDQRLWCASAMHPEMISPPPVFCVRRLAYPLHSTCQANDLTAPRNQMKCDIYN